MVAEIIAVDDFESDYLRMAASGKTQAVADQAA